ncbi:c-type cytochrome [Pseudomonas fluorescens]|uniref:Putative cytochrome c-type protein n=1 Tax=Pseudomonas fluorescens (strain Pf0-1) TaxID=205922 RepID=Q3KBY3_PSEPF|nr:c-type cytochrome [Pseudomonas fluorescens]ABA74722.1 putative cytochrome c-type protein [Pseudomonas fluorescens Pf0-1]MBY9026265.1 c-type cytochrome [Pseudomonas fluorescens]MBY9030110.1 c-type cytochrome [Pseudomonas fluorescens]MBY9038083.1 c-type cytochrome [Pseudomonas fluorescens]MBY9044187.1 c-type cytochrome [Pseudomonas fluorescens]
MKKIIFSACLVFFACAEAAQEPEAVFNRSCVMCHSGQLPAAPKKGDPSAWQPRLDKGMDVLVAHATGGYGAMPPRGLCMDCSAEDYRAVIDWMSK